MKKSIYISTVDINDPRNPGATIHLDIHEVPGGVIGISPEFVNDIANYIANPYEECQFVMLSDPMGGDEDPDPDLDEDELVGFLKIVNATEHALMKLDPEKRPDFVSGLSKISGLPADRIEFLFGLAKETLETLAFERFKKALQEE